MTRREALRVVLAGRGGAAPRHDWRASLYLGYAIQAHHAAKDSRARGWRGAARRWRTLARQWAARYRQHAMGEPER